MLQPNTGKNHVMIAKQHVYITVSDYGSGLFLKEIKISPGQLTWEWIDFRTNCYVNISNIDDNYCSFDNAINRAVNNPYSTVYEFDDFCEVFKDWKEIKYIDNISTIYKSKE